MLITVTNFRGCASARIDCAPIALLAGLNAAGKSSVAQAVGAALAGQALPVAGLRANAAGVLVRTGAATGTIEIATNAGTARLDWPEMRIAATGRPPSASVYATGLETIVALTPKDRARVLGDCLHADPTREDLEAALNDAGLDGATVTEAIWPAIERDGWDGVVLTRRERGAQLKGMWRQTTGANWGSRIAASWRPDLAGLNRDELEGEVKEARTARDHALTAAAVSADEKRRVEELADLADPRVAALERAKRRVEEYSAALAAAQQARQALPPAAQPSTVPCPYCGEPIVINRVSLVETRFERAAVAGIDDNELGVRRTAIAEADGKMAHANDDLVQARRQVSLAEQAVSDSFAARERLATWPRAVESGTDIAAAEARLVEISKRLAEVATKAEADRLHALIAGNEIVIDLLAADGLRAKKLARVVGVFNDTLERLSAAAGWAPVRVDASGGIGYGERIYALLSSSEQFRVRAILAVAMAQLDGSELVICDGADILDPPSRSGLFDLLGEVKIPALVCMTLPRSEMVPDLAAAGLGQSYWISAGVAAPLEYPAKAA